MNHDALQNSSPLTQEKQGSNLSSESGFTLVEIAVAVAILGVALTTLIGLHTSMLNIFLNEKARTEAAFYGQYVMTMIEVDPNVPEPQSDSGDLAGKLEELGYFEDTSDGTKKRADLSGWSYNLEVTSEAFQILEDAYRKVELDISWGESEDETFQLVYFLKSPTLDASIQALNSTLGNVQTGN